MKTNLKVYTSYFGMARKFQEYGIHPIGVAKRPTGRIVRYMPLVPKYKLGDPNWSAIYERQLASLDPAKVIKDLEEIARGCGLLSVALLCYEKNPQVCHRSMIARWLTYSGIDVKEFTYPLQISLIEL